MQRRTTMGLTPDSFQSVRFANGQRIMSADRLMELAAEAADTLAAAGLRVLLDDRAGLSPGVKLTDAELIGVPWILVAGRRAGEHVVELQDRRAGTREDLPLADALSRLISA